MQDVPGPSGNQTNDQSNHLFQLLIMFEDTAVTPLDIFLYPL